MYCCTFIRDEVFKEFKKEMNLPEDSYFVILKIDNKKYSYLIDGLHEVKCDLDLIKRYMNAVGATYRDEI